ncbi:N-acetylmuramoyl-L-alanine amidase [Hyphobacterium marinum]|uniref:N-acetylmuramoyl-L-alanine amidase n=1 Tax=Hyphobacterium marinum TaxID=3116574 RepID=A0ABU7M1A4_9PROT|nr:N-acetylmuramoyl-L-alanine amidase [Hyphobacterium sp. Y6023]MEE2567599.1 N-acetylmuramoyl-L-alanine amidase [Hyphobacterium sp. Y6023]
MRLQILISIFAGLVFSAAAHAQNPVIVVDAGHGGEDDGYYSWTGHPEAELVLRIAQRIEERLTASGGLDVRMTRSGEGGPSDETRLAIANAAGADLMLSIHADVASERASARGLIIYRASDLARRQVLARTIALGFAANEAEAGAALADRLGREEAFIGTLRASLPADLPLVVDEGRGALFDVLMDANTPALFVEFPFLSNSGEAVSPPLDDSQIAVVNAFADAVIAHHAVPTPG